MFKYYLNINNEFTFNNCYEVHKKQCSMVKQFKEEDLVDLGFFDSDAEAMKKASDYLGKSNYDWTKLNGCLVCLKAHHKR